MISGQNAKNLICWICGFNITEYFEIKYAGTRGKCIVCKIDFPLD